VAALLGRVKILPKS